MTSEEKNIREMLSQILVDSSIFGLRDNGWEAQFLLGDVNPKLAALGIDSIAIMELCVAIENRFGLTLVPTELAKLKSADALVKKILSHINS
jgi:hypothetical protein